MCQYAKVVSEIINVEEILNEIKNKIRWNELNDNIGLVPKWFKEGKNTFPRYDEYRSCFLNGVNCKQYTDQKIIDSVLRPYLNKNNNGWIKCGDNMPLPETEVLIVAKRKFRGGDFRYIITSAMYEDGTIRENDSCWNWYDIEGEWDEEEDCYIIPEGWWENKHYNLDECYNNQVDDEVIAWQYLPEYCEDKGGE